eukprot:TRINITY_DN1046_c0_g1_i2.p1 TRINITY_DN1046_c0_g1~~TRINITY_DN1046_c0_g1_i2.p1  ORF type:complete len:365 (-),score=94.83 TRINITY_DN1046_c0_g1_i2:89-1183(-)
MPSGWEYKLPEEFNHMTTEDIMDSMFGLDIRSDVQAAQAATQDPASREVLLNLHAELDTVKEEDLPESYNFFDAYKACRVEKAEQHSCGSCWAFAVAGAMTHRTCKILIDENLPAFPEDYRLSPQSLVSCAPKSVCSSGNCCKGGNTYNAWNWANSKSKEFINTLECFEYDSWSGDPYVDECQDERKDCTKWTKGKSGFFTTRKPVYGARFQTVPDSTAVLNFAPNKEMRETKIKQAIFKHGPVTANFKVPASFMGYRGKGVYVKEGPWLAKGALHSWHAIIIVGWGVENGVKYWLCENSWGNKYSKMSKGFRHMFKIRRGSDECYIESSGVYGGTPSLLFADGPSSIKEGWKRVWKKNHPSSV